MPLDITPETITSMTLGKGAQGEWLKSNAGRLAASQIIDTLRAAFDYMPEDSFKGAIRNALNLDSNLADGLEQRRIKYLNEPENSMSYRTLIRHERRGAELLVDAVERYQEPPSRKTFSSSLTVEQLRDALEQMQVELEAAQRRIREIAPERESIHDTANEDVRTDV